MKQFKPVKLVETAMTILLDGQLMDGWKNRGEVIRCRTVPRKFFGSGGDS